MQDTQNTDLVASTSRRDAIKNLFSLAVAGTALTLPLEIASATPSAAPVIATKANAQERAAEIIAKLNDVLGLIDADAVAGGHAGDFILDDFNDVVPPLNPESRRYLNTQSCAIFAGMFYGSDFASASDVEEAGIVAKEGFEIAQVFTRGLLDTDNRERASTLGFFFEAVAVAAVRFKANPA